MSSTIHVLETLCRELEAGASLALSAVVATRGSTPQPPGALIGVDESARIVGTLGGGCVEADIRRQAQALLREGCGKVLTFRLDHNWGYDDGMICGGEMDVAIQPLHPGDAFALRVALAQLREGRHAELTIRAMLHGRPVEYRFRVEAPPELVIAGGGHIGRRVAELGQMLGFRVSIIDDRAEFANSRRFPPPTCPVVGPIASTLRDWPIDSRTYIVIVTRGHMHDEEALEAVLTAPARYVGMIGSRRKIQVIFDDLRQRGATEEQLARVVAPIGLDIHAVTTEEIALSIAAQLTQVRRAGYSAVVQGPFQVAEAPA